MIIWKWLHIHSCKFIISTEKEDPTRLPLIIGAVVGSIVLIVIVFICFAIYFKNKKKMDKIQPLQVFDALLLATYYLTFNM